MPERIPIDDLTGAVDETARRLKRNTLVAGGAWVEVAAVGWLILAVAMDLLFALPVAWRVVAFAGFWVMFLTTLGLGVFWPTFRRPRPQEIALRIERALGGMHNRLVTLLDLRRRNGSRRVDPVMEARLVDQTRHRMAAYRVETVADPRAMRRAVIAMGGTVVLIAVMTLVFGASVPTAIARIVRPMADIPPATYLRIEPPGDLRILSGDPGIIEARFIRGSADTMAVRIRSLDVSDARWTEYSMELGVDGVFRYEIPSVTSRYAYRLVAGRTWTQVHGIIPVPRPMIESLTALVELPRYMGMSERLPVDTDTPRIVAPTGSTMHLSAKVTGDVSYGHAESFRIRTIETPRTLDDEVLWFDDDVPSDAQLMGRWRWTTDNAHSGQRAHTPNWDRKLYGFHTRLNPLRVNDGGVFFTYIYLDTDTPPKQVSITLHSGDQSRTLTWGDGDTPPPRLNRGSLPHTGRWSRLEAPISEVFTGGGVKLTGIEFHADNGRVLFDAAGYLTRTEIVESVDHAEPVGKTPMRTDNDGVWRGQMVIQESGPVSVTFFNDQDDPSRPMIPLNIVAAEDQPPTIIVERPAQDIVIPAPLPLPLLVRAFDDWALDSVGIETGDAPDRMSAPRWLDRLEIPRQTTVTVSSLDPRPSGLQPGHTLYYRLVARDRKGQEARSEIFKLTIASPQEAAAANKTTKPSPLDSIRKGLQRLLNPLKRIAEVAEALIPDLKKNPSQKFTREQIAQLAKDAAEKLNAEGRQALEQANQQIDALQRQLEALAMQLAKAAADSRKAPLASPLESEALEALAQQAAELADRLARQPPPDAGDPLAQDRADLERLLEAQQAASDEQAPIPQMQRQAEQIEAAREMSQEDAQAAQRQLEDLLTQMEAQRASQALESFESELADRRDELDMLARESQHLEERLSQADEDALDALRKQRDELAIEAQDARAESDVLVGQSTTETDPPATPKALREQLSVSAQRLEQAEGESRTLRGIIDAQRSDLENELAHNTPDPENESTTRAGDALRETLSNKETRRLLQLARRAQQAQQSASAGETSDSRSQRGKPNRLKPGTPSQPQPGTREVLILDGVELSGDGIDRAAIYRLPPMIRDPLLQGMQERGPEGYQPLIDAYYQQLTREAK